MGPVDYTPSNTIYLMGEVGTGLRGRNPPNKTERDFDIKQLS
jgi:hypothetical protein